MTKTALITEVGQLLGDTTAGFLTILGTKFDQVLRELAARGCLRSLRKTNASAFLVAGTMNYSTRTITGLSTPDYPMDLVQILVPAWQSLGRLERVSDYDFDKWRLAYTDSTGTAIRGRPAVWRLYPNEQQLQVCPVSSSDYVADSVEVEYVSPPTLLTGSDAITELRQEHIPYLLAGCVKYGAVFQDETRLDLRTAINEFELGIRQMKGEAERRRGMTIQARYRDV